MGKVDLSKYDNSWYNPGKSKLIILLWYICNVLFMINPLNPLSGLKVLILRLFGAKIGRNVVLKPGINIKYPWNLIVGDYVWIGERVWIDNLAKVSIADNACISQDAYLLTGNHNYKVQKFDLMIGEIKIEDGAWVGARAIVSPGLTCHSHSVLTAGSVATQNLDPDTIYQGNPATAKKKRVIS